MKIRDLGEFRLIKRIERQIKLSGRVVKGIGDDTAVLRYKKDRYLLFTCDMLVEGVHFHKGEAGYLVGRKSVSVNVSDIASMGGIPQYAVISLGVPKSLNLGYVDGLYRGIRDVARKFKIDIVGGDTVGSDKIVINIALMGEVERKNLVLRSGAKDKDAIFMTGSIGGSLKGRHLAFMPRLDETRFLVKNFRINSMIDISDGLLADLGHILESSNVGAVIYEKAIPISKDAEDFKNALSDGEDFELIFTISRSEERRLMKTWPFKTRISRIGEIYKRRKGLFLVRRNAREEKIRPGGYTHF